MEARSKCHTQSSSKVRSLEAALAALGPEESSAKTEIGLALKQVREQATAQVAFDPEARMAAGHNKVARLEQAIAAMGDLKGPAMDALVTALKRAQQEAQEMPLESQAREAFLERARNRLVHIDQERAAEVLRIQECERRLEELRVSQNADSEEGGQRAIDRSKVSGVDGRSAGRYERRAHVRKSSRSGARVRSDHRCDQEPPISDDATFNDHEHGQLICHHTFG